MRTRRGAVSLPELVLVCWLFGVVLTGVAVFATSLGRVARVQRDRLRAEEVFRTAAVVLAGELRYAGPPQVVALADDSLRLRAVRGSGAICGGSGRDLLVRYRGVRRPEPEKDSVLLLSAGEPATGPSVERLAVDEVAGSSSCGGSLRVTLSAAPSHPRGVVLVFETGTYALTGQALRYRFGAAGRQPLTEAILADAQLVGSADLPLRLRLATRRDSLPALPPLSRWVPLTRLNLARP